MYTELVKIIEGGLTGDKDKVSNYATILAENLNAKGEVALSKKIKTILENKKFTMTALDSFSTKPVDTESRMNIVDITYPQISSTQIVLNKYVGEELNNFIECYTKRDALLKAGVNFSNSLLLYGPPGCGKTTLAQYVASVTQLPLVTARLDSLVSSLLGSTAKNIRKIFDYTSKQECILFIDEFDAVAKLRDDKNELGELKRVVNSLIQNIDTFSESSLLIAATNHHELLDPAIWRRFSKIINLEKPKRDEIQKLLTIYLENVKNDILENDKKIDQLKIAFDGFSHSDIKTAINNAIKYSIIQDRKNITIYDVFREIFLYKNHGTGSEDDFLRYLIQNNIPHKEINKTLGVSLRKIQNISKNRT